MYVVSGGWEVDDEKREKKSDAGSPRLGTPCFFCLDANFHARKAVIRMMTRPPTLKPTISGTLRWLLLAPELEFELGLGLGLVSGEDGEDGWEVVVAGELNAEIDDCAEEEVDVGFGFWVAENS